MGSKRQLWRHEEVPVSPFREKGHVNTRGHNMSLIFICVHLPLDNVKLERKSRQHIDKKQLTLHYDAFFHVDEKATEVILTLNVEIQVWDCLLSLVCKCKQSGGYAIAFA